ncbi:MAG: HAD family hydrolase [Desulfobacterales bacterium]|jgi:putative hydrolase of the HAD superfamily
MTAEKAIFERHIRILKPAPTGVAPRLEGMQNFRAVLFDVYGTLLISGSGDIGIGRERPVKEEDLQDLLRRRHIDRTPYGLSAAVHRAIEQEHEKARRQGIDFPEVDIVRVWQAVLGIDDLRRLKSFILEYELMVNPVYPMPGLNTLLSAFRAHRMPMGIISNAQFYTPDILEWFLRSSVKKSGFNPRLIFLSYRFGYAKPSMFMFKRAAAELSRIGIPVEATLYVGNDMLNDIRPAGAVGFKTALFAGDGRSLRPRESDDRCRGLSPNLVVTDLRQLIAATVNP